MVASNSAEIAQKWRARYQREAAEWSQRPPNWLLTEYADLLPTAGLALDAAAGVGINSIFLAQRGMRVVALDIAETALDLLNRRAYLARLPIATAVCDLSHPWLPPNRFDCIINFNFLERATFATYRHALRPGGTLVFSTFVQPTAQHSSEPFFLRPNELQTAFANFTTRHHSQSSYFHQRSGTTRYVEHLIATK